MTVLGYMWLLCAVVPLTFCIMAQQSGERPQFWFLALMTGYCILEAACRFIKRDNEEKWEEAHSLQSTSPRSDGEGE